MKNKKYLETTHVTCRWRARVTRTSREGLVLLDVLLALVLFSLSVAFLIQSLSESCRALVYSQDYSAAVFLAEDKMAGILARGALEEDAAVQGTAAPPFQKMNYTVDAGPARDQRLEEQLQDVKVTVQWLMGGKMRTMVLEGLIFYAT